MKLADGTRFQTQKRADEINGMDVDFQTQISIQFANGRCSLREHNVERIVIFAERIATMDTVLRPRAEIPYEGDRSRQSGLETPTSHRYE